MAALSSRYAYEGTETTEVAITRVGSPADPTGQVQSRKIVTTANSQWLRPFRAEPYVIWNPTAGADVGVTVYGTVNSGALPLNDEIFMEVEYLTLSGAAPLGKLVSTTKSNVLATPAAVSADGSTWSNIPPTTFDGSASAGIVISNGGLTVTHGTTSGSVGARSLAYRSAGKFYFEMTSQGGTRSGHVIGVLLSTGTYGNAGVGQDGTLVSSTSGSVYSNNVSTGKSIGVWVVGDVIGLAIDLTSGLAWFRRNAGNWNGDAAANPATGVGGVFVQAATFSPVVLFSTNGTTDAFTANFGTTSYVNAAPSGFLNWNDGWVPFKLTATLNAPQPGLAGYIDVRVRAARPASTFYIDPTVVLTPAAGGTNNAATAYTSSRYTYEGTETTETSITRVGGAVDPTGQAQSRKIVTTANAQWLRPFKAEPYAIWNAVNGISVTVTLCGVVNATALPLNDEIFMEVEYLTLSSQAAQTSFDGSVSTNITLSNGNLTLTHPNTNAGSANSASNVSAGKYYFELTSTVSFGSLTSLGLMLPGGSSSMTGSSSTVGVFPTVGASKIYSGAVDTTKDLGAWAVGAVLGVAVDLDARLAWFRKNNGSWNASGTANPATGVGGVTIPPNSSFTPVVGFTNASGSGEVVTGNFGATAYANATPSGFSNWATPAAPLGKLVTTTKSNVLATGSAVAADASSWAAPAYTSWSETDRSNVTLSNNNLTALTTSAGTGVRGYTGRSTGKFYWEFALTAVGVSGAAFGLATASAILFGAAQAGQAVCIKQVSAFGGIHINGVYSGIAIGSFTSGDRIDVAVDLTAALIWFRKSGGNWNGSGTANPATGVGGVSLGVLSGNVLFPFFGADGTGQNITANFGDTTFIGPVPSGFTSGWPAIWTPFKLTATLNSPQPGVAGYIHTRVRAAKPGAVYYIDPKITLS